MNSLPDYNNENKVIYSLVIEDVQRVAKDYLKRKLTSAEIERVIEKLPDYIDWYESIEAAIYNEHF